MFKKNLILGIMLLNLIANNNTKAMQLDSINTRVNRATNEKRIFAYYGELLETGDGCKYASDLLVLWRGRKEPLVLVLRGFGEIRRGRSVLIDAFLDEVKKILDNPDNDINVSEIREDKDY